MELSPQQSTQYRDEGYVVIDGMLNQDEVDILREAVTALAQYRGPQANLDRKTGAVMVVYGVHRLDQRIESASRHPALLGIAEALTGSKVFIHQSRLVTKSYMGAAVDWHQDFGTYHRVDGVPTPNGIMISILLDDITDLNAPITILPGSHKEGLLDERFVTKTEVPNEQAAPDPGGSKISGAQFTLSEAALAGLVAKYGLKPITGKAGAVLFLNMNVLHGSTVNISPFPRRILYINVCAENNQGRAFVRPDYIAARDFTPLTPAAPDCLVRLAS